MHCTPSEDAVAIMTVSGISRSLYDARLGPAWLLQSKPFDHQYLHMTAFEVLAQTLQKAVDSLFGDPAAHHRHRIGLKVGRR